MARGLRQMMKDNEEEGRIWHNLWWSNELGKAAYYANHYDHYLYTNSVDATAPIRQRVTVDSMYIVFCVSEPMSDDA